MLTVKYWEEYRPSFGRDYDYTPKIIEKSGLNEICTYDENDVEFLKE